LTRRQNITDSFEQTEYHAEPTFDIECDDAITPCIDIEAIFRCNDPSLSPSRARVRLATRELS